MKNFTTIFPFLFPLIFVFYTSLGYAAEGIDNIIREQSRAIQNQQQSEQDKQRKNELQNMEVERKEIEEESEEEGEDLETKSSRRKCFQVVQITILKNKILSDLEGQSLTHDYLGKCLAIDEINQLLQKISDKLSEKEYVTSKAVLLKRDLIKKELIIDIIEGQLEDIIFNDDTLFDKMQKFSAFGPIKKRTTLNLHEINIGVDQINRLPSNSASMKLASGSYANSSILAIQNKPKNTLRTNFSFDDLGNHATGKRRDTIGFSYDNLLHLNDSFVFSRVANDFSHKKELGNSEVLSFGFSVPFKNHLLTLGHTRYYYSLIKGDVEQFRASGESLTSSANLESIILKRKKFNLKSQLGLTTRNITNYISEEKNDASTRKASIATLAFLSKIFIDKSAILLKPSYSKGLKILNARQDGNEISDQSAHAQFSAFKFYANYSQALQVPVLKVPCNYSLSFDSQLSKQRLYSSDQFFIGGAYTVRGFESGSIGGDSGYLLKNEASFNLGNIIVPMLPKHAASTLAGLYNFSVTPFYDYGYIKMHGINQAGRLAGSGFKTSFTHKNLTANLTLSWVTNKSVLLQSYYRENQAVYFDVTTNFGFF